jgi:hypothetical protein
MATVRRRFPRLLRRCKLLPRESLPSLLVRLAQLNYYEPVTILRRLVLAGAERDRLDWPAQAQIYERLFELVWLDPHRLHEATGHYFAETLTPPGRQVDGLSCSLGGHMPALAPEIAREQLRPELAAQFCPLCLKEAQYHRLSWLPVAISACITHKRLLVDCCPACQAKLSIRAIVEDCRCRRCGAELQTATSARLNNDDFGLLAQRFIHGWLKVGRFPSKSSHTEWLRHYPRPLFCLVDGLVDGMKAIGSDWWGYLHQPVTRSPLTSFGPIRGRLTPEQSYRLYATAFKILLDWPQGFHEFLQAYTRRDGQLKRGIAEDLGRLGARWFNDRWQHPDFSFVHDALAQYLVDVYVTTPSTAPPNDQATLTFVSPIRAARLLEVSVSTIKRLVKAGFLVGYKVEYGQPRQYGSVRRDELLTLRLAWRNPLSLEDATKWLGLTKSIVVDLIRVGLLTAESYPEQVDDRPWLFSKQSLDECYRAVTRGVIRGGGYSRLAEAARTLSVVGLKVADILKLVAQGKLHCWAPSEAPALAKLSFDRSEIEAVLENPDYGKGLLSSEHAAYRLGVEWPTFFRWARTGLFSSVVTYAYDAYFDPDDIDAFLADHITSQEAAKMLEADVAELEGWYFEWGLEAVKGVDLNGQTLCLFRRKDVKRVKAIEAKKVAQNKNI